MQDFLAWCSMSLGGAKREEPWNPNNTSGIGSRKHEKH